ncbi:RecQ family ATP-dependent DNA helicase [Sphingobacterium kyonggiense]|uniref:DNA 3'-5' helicase n=1 Tax=Sphingobacterium kyonggiense TaxID=714075 RepID=A0ABP7Z4T3_9SPHI
MLAFIDTEIDPKSNRILDIGSIKDDGNSFHHPSVESFTQFIKGSRFVCGHNIINHDILYIGNAINLAGINVDSVIDTLFLSPLLFPTSPYHALVKDDKLQTDESNNPLNDAIKAKNLFYDEVNAFNRLEKPFQQILYLLLKDQKEFAAFFKFIKIQSYYLNLADLIKTVFHNEICDHVDLENFILNKPIELAYCLALINSFFQHSKVNSITPRWLLKNYPEVEQLMTLLRSKPCVSGCAYCNRVLDPILALKKYFGYDSYRTFAGEALQEKAVQAAIDNKSILAIFPTGGGKSITFQVPALLSGETSKGLTVIISPLQSLMKDQVDNLEKNGITDAVTINGLLDPIERAKSFERVENGSASLLYISPESLRSKSIERLILGRKIARFVIDEAHCFSSWGQDFRVDYLYIGDFIKSIQEKKNLDNPIPVSCFTATAKQKVIEDIQEYFQEKLSIDLKLFTSNASRTNLQYKVYEKNDENDKYQTIRDLIEQKDCPTIIYVSRTKTAYKLAERLNNDGFNAKAYHGKMEKQEKTENQNSFINGDTQIMVATSAFGMGVDKKDVGLVIHFEISDSLENYVQEAGRAGRDENITADCFVLFNEEDLSKHFILLNQTKLSIKEIQQIWRAIKDITRFRSTASNSALEIARKAGWDENVLDIETRVTTAIAALEEAGYLKRGQNMPRVFANSILSKNVNEAIEKINSSNRFIQSQKQNAIRIIRKLFSSKNKKNSSEEVAESRIDYISDHLGIVKDEVITIINLLREERILADSKDLNAFIKKGEHKNRSLQIVEEFSKIENFLIRYIDLEEKIFHLKELNELAEKEGLTDISSNKLKTIFNIWAIKNWIKRKNLSSKNHIAIISLLDSGVLKEKLAKRQMLARFIIDFLYERSRRHLDQSESEEVLVEFSVHELKNRYESSNELFKIECSVEDIEDTLFYLSRIEAIKIEGGFLVLYNRLTIERKEQNNKKQYTKDDYQKLYEFYENKIQQIHIVGEYAKKMLEDYKSALQFVDDYFKLNYSSFLNKYFKGSRQNEIKRNITPSKFKELFGELSPVQLKIINDKDSKYIVVAAGPGSGKTRILVHKLASLLLMEDLKHEQLLMITFSRAAASEFKKRLLKLIGNAANFIEIKTFHSYCFDLLGRIGTLDKAKDVINKAIEKINNKEVEVSRITKAVLVIDEAQDMDENEFELIKSLMQHNEEMRVIAVGDDDQNIYGFRGANSKYLQQIISNYQAEKYELVENYRSKSNLVAFSNQFVNNIQNRLKSNSIIPMQNENGKFKVTQFQSENLIYPTVQDIISTDLIGTTCVLTKTNDEALQVTGMLLKNNIKAKLIQSNEGFSLYNLLEIRFFMDQLTSNNQVFTISDEAWLSAKKEVYRKYKMSSKLEILINLIKDFELSNPKTRYYSDLLVYIHESKLEDFMAENGETILVSTIHKAKGKEFNNVFLMLNKYNLLNDEEKRLLYVALTRAKSNLSIYVNNPIFQSIKIDNLTIIEDRETYQPSNEIVFQLTFKDIWLDFFKNKQHLIDKLISGDSLQVNEVGCNDLTGLPILKYSKQFLNQIENLRSKNYHLKSAKINFIVFWKNEELDKEYQIILPEISFIKSIENRSIN